jgi:hypothetical protein
MFNAKYNKILEKEINTHTEPGRPVVRTVGRITHFENIQYIE